MKKLFLLLVLMGVVVVGCSKDEVDKGNDNKTEQPNENDGGNENDIPENIFFGLDKESITISPNGGSVDVVVYSNYKWEISGASDWCTPSVKKGDANEDGQKVTFSADVAYDDREATFWFRCADEKIKFVVTQDSAISADEILYTNGSTTEPTAPYKTNVFGVNIVSNTYDSEKECWVIKFDGDVTTIGDYAFYNCSSLTSVTIPDSVTTIGECAFCECSSLTSVTIPDSVTTIGYKAFSNCSSLTSVTIPDSVTTIGRAAFYSCSSLTSVTIPDSVTTIGDYAFYECSSLTEFRGKYASEDGRCLIIDGTLNSFAPAGLTEYTIPDSVTTIGAWAFSGCSSLTSVTIPDSVTTIGEDAFYNCSSLTSITIPDSVTTIGDYAFYVCSSLTSITIPDSVTTIGEGVFCACSSLTSLTIPDSVTTIGDSAFSACGSLTSVTIPDSVTTIGDWAFSWCDSLTSVTIPDSVTEIGSSAFAYCSSLTSVTIPDSVTTIGEGAFVDCSSLREFNGKYASEDGRCLIIDGTLNSFAIGCGVTEYTIPDSVTTIGRGAFSGCSSLTSVTIPDSVTEIGGYAFYNCDSLTSVTIPDSVTSIGDSAFEGCSSLTSVYCKATTPPTAVLPYGSWNAFNDNASGRMIYVPMQSVETYKSASYWSDYADSIVGYNF